MPADIPDVHPNVANVYRKNVAQFTEALDDPDGGREAAQALRSLIGEIVLIPGKSVARSMPSYAACLWASLSSQIPREIKELDILMPAAAACP